jgi:hypothetical protein
VIFEDFLVLFPKNTSSHTAERKMSTKKPSVCNAFISEVIEVCFSIFSFTYPGTYMRPKPFLLSANHIGTYLHNSNACYIFPKRLTFLRDSNPDLQIWSNVMKRILPSRFKFLIWRQKIGFEICAPKNWI